LSLYALYWVLFIVQPQIYRVSFLLVALVLTFLVFPSRRGDLRGVAPLDWLLMAATIVALSWPIYDFEAFIYRAADPRPVDLALGLLTIALVLEATRRSVGGILPSTALGFLLYAYAGPQFDRIGMPLLAHRGYDVDRLVGTLYMTLEGIFGVPLDVAATYIVLFTIYGAVLERSGAGAFFINWAMAAMGRSRSGAGSGRTVTVAGFLLGTVSGSGVATTVMLGSVAWPLLRRAGYRPETGGAILSAAGHRRHPGAADARRRGVPHRRVPPHLVPPGARHGDHPGGALLPVDLPDDRGRLAPAGHAPGRHRRRPLGELTRRYGTTSRRSSRSPG
jgi:TRAP-type uncharacterized transport system fused permease subunit